MTMARTGLDWAVVDVHVDSFDLERAPPLAPLHSHSLRKTRWEEVVRPRLFHLHLHFGLYRQQAAGSTPTPTSVEMMFGNDDIESY